MRRTVSANGHEGVSRRGLLALMGTAAGVLAAYPDAAKAASTDGAIAIEEVRPGRMSSPISPGSMGASIKRSISG
jgi:ethanolamine ammonia-lyase large subunit